MCRLLHVLIADGSTGSYTAYHFDPYVNHESNYGFLITSEQDLLTCSLGADLAGLQVAIHACGDKANRVVLDVFQNVTKTNPSRDRRFRIEHAESVRDQDLSAFKDLKVFAR